MPHPRLKALAVGDHEVGARAWYEHMPVCTVKVLLVIVPVCTVEVGFRGMRTVNLGLGPICTVAVLLVLQLPDPYLASKPLEWRKTTQPPMRVTPHRGPQLCLPVAVAMLPFPVRCLPRWKLYMVQPFEGKGDPAPPPDPAAAPDPTAIPTDPTAYPP